MENERTVQQNEEFTLVDLAFSAEMKYILGLCIVSLLVFIPSGGVYFGGMLFIGVLFIPMLIMGIVLLVRNPALLEKRLSAKEKEKTQRGVVGISALMFLGGFILSGIDRRNMWLPLPEWLSVIGATIFLLGYIMYAEVLRENIYLSRTVEVQKGQQVIDTGLYGIIRHPMYTATIIMFISIPIVLGSVIALPVFLIYPVLIVLRLGNEEKVLCRDLPGYRQYRKRVQYRLIPRIY